MLPGARGSSSPRFRSTRDGFSGRVEYGNTQGKLARGIRRDETPASANRSVSFGASSLTELSNFAPLLGEGTFCALCCAGPDEEGSGRACGNSDPPNG